MPHPQNHTGIRAFDRLARDPRVESVRDEGSCCDYDYRTGEEFQHSFWVDLAPGWYFEGCISIHGYTVSDVISDFSRISQER